MLWPYLVAFGAGIWLSQYIHHFQLHFAWAKPRRTESQNGEISIAFSAGLTAGAAFWGILVDIIGCTLAYVDILLLEIMY